MTPLVTCGYNYMLEARIKYLEIHRVEGASEVRGQKLKILLTDEYTSREFTAYTSRKKECVVSSQRQRLPIRTGLHAK